jgi:hypothetical protein
MRSVRHVSLSHSLDLLWSGFFVKRRNEPVNQQEPRVTKRLQKRGVYRSMNSFLLRYRWAIVLAALQGALFSSLAISEHRRNLRENHKEVVTHIEFFACFELPRQRIPSEDRSDDSECRLAPKFKFLFLSNLPVFMVWGGIAALSRNTNFDQLWMFYVINGFGIPLFWFFIGSLIDRRRLKRVAAGLNPPMEQD